LIYNHTGESWGSKGEREEETVWEGKRRNAFSRSFVRRRRERRPEEKEKLVFPSPGEKQKGFPEKVMDR